MGFLEEGVYSFLRQQVAVTALVADRIYPLVIRQTKGDKAAVMPAITYRRTGTSFEDPPLQGISYLYTVDMDIECWSESYSEAKTVADAVEVSLNGVTDQLMGNFSVGQALIRNLADQFEVELDLYFVVGSWTFSACRQTQ